MTKFTQCIAGLDNGAFENDTSVETHTYYFEIKLSDGKKIRIIIRPPSSLLIMSFNDRFEAFQYFYNQMEHLHVNIFK